MKPVSLDIPSRDLGRSRIRDFGDALIRRLESVERRLAAKEPSRAGTPPVILTTERALLDRLDSQTGDAVTLERQRILHRALDEEYFRREMSSGTVVYEGGTAADAINQNSAVMRVPATGVGVPSMIHRTFGMNELWARTRPRLLLWYTSPVGSTANFDLRFQLRMFAVGGTTAPGLLFSTNLVVPGPAVANTVLFATVVGGAVVPAIPAPLRFTIARVGADPNVNALDIILAVVVFEEVA